MGPVIRRPHSRFYSFVYSPALTYKSYMKEITVSNQTVIRVLAITLAFFASLWLMERLQRELFWLFTAFFLALTLNPGVTWFQRFMPKRNRPASIGAVFVSLILVITGISYMLIPPLVEQSNNLAQQAPQLIEDARNGDGLVGRTIERYNLGDRLQQEQERIFQEVAKATGSFIGLAQGLFSGIISVVVILTLTFFMLLEGPRWIKMAVSHQHADQQPRTNELLVRLYMAVRSYTIGNLTRSLIISIVTLIPLLAFSVPYALPLSILMGVLNLIPLVGATIGSVIVVVVCLFVSLPAAIFMGIYLVIYQQIENNVIQPLIFGHSLELSALTVLVSALIGASLAGFLGAFVAIPAAAAIRILIDHHHKYRHKPLRAARA